MNDSAPAQTEYILKMQCPDTCGIVAAVSGVLLEMRGFILEAAHFSDPGSKTFFSRIKWSLPRGRHADADIGERLAEMAAPMAMRWSLHPCERRYRVMLMVSGQGHCLNDLLYRCRVGALPMDISVVASNHDLLRPLVESYGAPWRHLPVSAQNRAEQESQIWALLEETRSDFLVLARYMQVLSPALCEKLAHRAINIHHSFLPSFQGAKPYHQAYRRGVKLIGATAHFVTADLDEGPIIEQGVERVEHTATPERLAAIGRDLECVVLSRALRYLLEDRTFVNGAKTVVFR